MDAPYGFGCCIPKCLRRPTAALEELSEPLEEPDEAKTQSLAPGTTLAPEDEDPITVIRLLRDGFPLRLYEARQDEETLWLWERVGESASLLKDEGEFSENFAARCSLESRQALAWTGILSCNGKFLRRDAGSTAFRGKARCTSRGFRFFLRSRSRSQNFMMRVSFIWEFAQESLPGTSDERSSSSLM